MGAICSYLTGWFSTGGLGGEQSGLGAGGLSASTAGPKIKSEELS